MGKVLVIGMGVSGRAATAFLQKRGYSVVSVDAKVEGALRDDQEIEPFDFSFVVLSPGIPRTHLLCRQAERCGVPVLGEMELALRALRNPAVGITGTNGKTTLTMLTTHVLQSMGYKARSLGNVGLPLTSVIDELEEGEIAVIELSSYQLETMEQKVFDVGIITNLTPDHLDRYKTMENYAAAKLRLRGCLKPGAPFYVHQDLSPYVADAGFPMNEEILMLALSLKSMVTLPTGEENVIAGFLLTKVFGVTVDSYLRALETFQRPRHRMEHIALIDGVEFCNDSKATNVASLSFALDTVHKPLYLIMGGRSKGSSYEPLIPKMKGLVKEVLTIGEAALEIEEALREQVPCVRAETLEKAVALAYQKAKEGDMILLSPACSSFDQFKNYEDRGDQFRNLVTKL